MAPIPAALSSLSVYKRGGLFLLSLVRTHGAHRVKHHLGLLSLESTIPSSLQEFAKKTWGELQALALSLWVKWGGRGMWPVESPGASSSRPHPTLPPPPSASPSTHTPHHPPTPARLSVLSPIPASSLGFLKICCCHQLHLH